MLLDAVVLSGDGVRRIAAAGDDVPEEAAALGRHVAKGLIAQGATDLIAATRSGQRDTEVP